ncbi:MAG: hypothetical protein AAF614_05570 [Chloroflexota bacterium]
MMGITAVFLLTNILSQIGIDEPNKFNNFLIMGFAIMWIIGVIYVVSLASRQRNVQQDIELMQQILEDEENLNGS